MASTSRLTRMRTVWLADDGVVTTEWLALAGAVAIGAIAVFWWATSPPSSGGGFQPTANAIQSQVDSAASGSVSSAQ